MLDLIRKLRVQMQNLVTRVVVDRSDDVGGTYQVLWGGDRTTSGLEHLETQGVHFRAPADAGGVVVSAGGQRDGGVLVAAGGLVPKDPLGEGEGGLHYLGEFKVFLRSDGIVCLGAKLPNDWVALASLVDSEIGKLKSDIQSIVSCFNNWTPVPNDGGAALKAQTASLATVPHTPASVASEKVRCS